MAIVSFDSRGSKRRVPSVSYADSPYGQNLNCRWFQRQLRHAFHFHYPTGLESAF
jgi:hypothetical protein